MYKNKKGEIIGIILTIIILVLLVILTNTENSNLSYVENVANKLVNPLQNGITYVKNKIHGNSSFFTNINELKRNITKYGFGTWENGDVFAIRRTVTGSGDSISLGSDCEVCYKPKTSESSEIVNIGKIDINHPVK